VLLNLGPPTAPRAGNLIACLFEYMSGFVLTTLLLFGHDVVNAMDKRIFPANRAVCARIIASNHRGLHSELTRGESKRHTEQILCPQF